MYVDSTSDALYVFTWNGSTWSQVGTQTSLGAMGSPSIDMINTTDLAFVDATNDQIRTYRLSGGTWSLVGNTLSVAGVTAPTLTAFPGNYTDIVIGDTTLDTLKMYRWDGTDWKSFGETYTLAGTEPEVLGLTADTFAYLDNVNDYLRTFRLTETTSFTSSAGSVGIGTQTPTANLDIRGTTSTIPFQVASSSGDILLKLTQDGYLGIGTSTPFEALSVAGKIAATGGVFLDTGTPSDTNNSLYNVGGTLYWNGSVVSASNGQGGDKYAVLVDSKSSGTNAGGATAGSWATRDLNTEKYDDIGVSISSNEFTLPAGTYEIEASAPAYNTNRHQIRLYNVTDATAIAYGSSEFSGVTGSYADQVRSTLTYVFTIDDSKTFRIEHRVGQSAATYGLGVAVGSSFTTGEEIYTIVNLRKLGSGDGVFTASSNNAYFTGGNIGIGTTSASSLLSLEQSSDTASGGLWIAASDGDYRSIYMGTDQVLNFAGGSGNTATLNAIGAWTNASDIAYKENITELDYGLEEIMLLNPRRYTWKSNGASDIGFIAQELEQVIPEVVFGTDGSKTVSYGQLTSLAISGLQDFGMRIDVLEAPTSTPSLKLDADGKLIVNSGFSVQNEASIGSLSVLEGATFAEGLTVTGTSSSSFGGALLIEGSVTLGAGDITISSNGIESANSFAFNESQLVIATSGIGIGTTTPDRMLHVVREGEGSPVRFQDANGYCEINPTTASLICTSDQTLKENITELTSAPVLEQLRALQPVTFEWMSDTTDTERVGFIAQEVEVVIPDLVYTDPETGLKSVAYGGFVPYIIAGVKELAEKVDALTIQLETLTARIEEIASRGYSAATGAFQNLKVGSPERPSGITIYDEETGEPYCLTTKNGSLVTRSGECGTPREDVTSTNEQHVLDEDGEGSIEVPDGSSVDVNELFEINATSTSTTTEDVVVPELVPEPVVIEDAEPELELVIEDPVVDAVQESVDTPVAQEVAESSVDPEPEPLTE